MLEEQRLWLCIVFYKQLIHSTFFIFIVKRVIITKINELWYIALFSVSESIKKLFSIDCINIYFCKSIVNYIFSIDLKVWGYPTLLISCFINFKVGLSPSKKNFFYLFQWNPFKNNEKCVLFHLNCSFRYQDIWVFVTTFWPSRKNGLMRKIRLISKSMTLQPG